MCLIKLIHFIGFFDISKKFHDSNGNGKRFFNIMGGNWNINSPSRTPVLYSRMKDALLFDGLFMDKHFY